MAYSVTTNLTSGPRRLELGVWHMHIINLTQPVLYEQPQSQSITSRRQLLPPRTAAKETEAFSVADAGQAVSSAEKKEAPNWRQPSGTIVRGIERLTGQTR